MTEASLTKLMKQFELDCNYDLTVCTNGIVTTINVFETELYAISTPTNSPGPIALMSTQSTRRPLMILALTY